MKPCGYFPEILLCRKKFCEGLCVVFLLLEHSKEILLLGKQKESRRQKKRLQLWKITFFPPFFCVQLRLNFAQNEVFGFCFLHSVELGRRSGAITETDNAFSVCSGTRVLKRLITSSAAKCFQLLMKSEWSHAVYL